MFSGVSKIGFTPFTNSFLVLRPFIRRFATFPFFFLAILYCPFRLGSSLLLLDVTCDILSEKGDYIMEALLSTWLPPAVIVGVIFWTNSMTKNSLNQRIDDLRNQMQREHDTLSKKVDNNFNSLSERIDKLLERHQ